MPFRQPIMEACLKAARELHAETAAANPNFKKVLESLTAFSNNGYQWFQVAEVGYDNFMARNSQRLIGRSHIRRTKKPRSEAPGFL